MVLSGGLLAPFHVARRFAPDNSLTRPAGPQQGLETIPAFSINDLRQQGTAADAGSAGEVGGVLRRGVQCGGRVADDRRPVPEARGRGLQPGERCSDSIARSRSVLKTPSTVCSTSATASPVNSTSGPSRCSATLLSVWPGIDSTRAPPPNSRTSPSSTSRSTRHGGAGGIGGRPSWMGRSQSVRTGGGFGHRPADDGCVEAVRDHLDAAPVGDVGRGAGVVGVRVGEDQPDDPVGVHARRPQRLGDQRRRTGHTAVDQGQRAAVVLYVDLTEVRRDHTQAGQHLDDLHAESKPAPSAPDPAFLLRGERLRKARPAPAARTPDGPPSGPDRPLRVARSAAADVNRPRRNADLSTSRRGVGQRLDNLGDLLAPGAQLGRARAKP